jgi:putative nucleotidyltransferase with HDIG domain
VTLCRQTGSVARCVVQRRGPTGVFGPAQASATPLPARGGEPVEYLVRWTRILAEHSLIEVVRAQAEDLTLLHDLTERAGAGAPLDEILTLLSERIQASFGAIDGVVYLLDAHREHLVLRLAGIGRAARTRIQRILGRAIPNVKIPLAKAPILSAALRAEGATSIDGEVDILALMAEHGHVPLPEVTLPLVVRKLGIASSALVPLGDGRLVIGLLSVSRSRSFSDAELRRLDHVSRQVGALIAYRRVRAEGERLAQRHALLLESIDEGILGLDHRGTVILANTAARSLLHATGSLEGTRFEDLCDGEAGHRLCETQSCPVLEALGTRESLGECLCRLRDAGGSGMPVLLRARAVTEPDLALVVTFRDIRERLRAQEVERAGTERLRRSFAGTIQALCRLTELRDPYTAGHQQRVARLARAIAQRMGLDEGVVERVRLAATIHDIGKHAVPVEILTRPGRLTRQEMDLIRTHPTTGWEILEQVGFEEPISRIVHEHHERLDGRGYPNGLTGDAICLEARILAVADTVEAMSAHRPHRPAFSLTQALAEIQAQAGRAFDPAVVAACVALCQAEGFSLEEGMPRP